MNFTNEPYDFEVGPPLLRPGLKLKVGPFSKKYAQTCMADAMEIVRAFNSSEKAKQEKNTKSQESRTSTK